MRLATCSLPSMPQLRQMQVMHFSTKAHVPEAECQAGSSQIREASEKPTLYSVQPLESKMISFSMLVLMHPTQVAFLIGFKYGFTAVIQTEGGRTSPISDLQNCSRKFLQTRLTKLLPQKYGLVVNDQIINQCLNSMLLLLLLLLLLMVCSNRLPHNSFDLCHCLVPWMVVRPQPQALLIHLHDCGRQAFLVPASIP